MYKIAIALEFDRPIYFNVKNYDTYPEFIRAINKHGFSEFDGELVWYISDDFVSGNITDEFNHMLYDSVIDDIYKAYTVTKVLLELPQIFVEDGIRFLNNNVKLLDNHTWNQLLSKIEFWNKDE